VLIDGREVARDQTIIYDDVVIVGAGTVGLYLASRLVAQGRSVTMIEAGGRVARQPAATEVIGKPHNGARIGRAIGLGGTSTLWGGQLVEFEKSDLEREDYPWPITYAELQSWYSRTYQDLGLRGNPTPSDYEKALGITRNSHATIEPFFTSWLPQPNFAALFKDTINHPRVRIILETSANRFQFEDKNLNALHAVTSNDTRLRIGGSTFVVAAGTLAGAQLFLNAQRLDGTPWKNSPHVGAAFQDHLGLTIAKMEVQDDARFRCFFENAFRFGRKVQPKLRLKANARKRGLTGVCGFFAFNSDISEHLANCKRFVRSISSAMDGTSIASFGSDLMKLSRMIVPIVCRYIGQRRILAFYDRGVQFCIQAEQRTMPESRIVLAETETPRSGLLPIKLDWRVDPNHLESIRYFTRQADDFLRSEKIGRLEYVEELWQNDIEFLEALSDTYHQCGGLLMGSSRDASVVDADCRVWGTTNLFVAGSAVFPTSSYANTTFTALALAARLASRISNDRTLA